MKTIGKIIMIDLLVVSVVSAFFISKSLIQQQYINDPVRGVIRTEKTDIFICPSLDDDYYHGCSFMDLLGEGISLLPFYIIIGGYADVIYLNPYSIANLILLIFLSYYFLRNVRANGRLQ